MPGQMWRIRLTQIVVALAGSVVWIESARLALRTSWYAFGNNSTWSAVLGLASGAALVLAGTIEIGSPANRTSGALLATAGLAWLITAWDNPPRRRGSPLRAGSSTLFGRCCWPMHR